MASSALAADARIGFGFGSSESILASPVAVLTMGGGSMDEVGWLAAGEHGGGSMDEVGWLAAGELQ